MCLFFSPLPFNLSKTPSRSVLRKTHPSAEISACEASSFLSYRSAAGISVGMTHRPAFSPAMSSTYRNVLLLLKEWWDLPVKTAFPSGAVTESCRSKNPAQGFKVHLDMSIYSFEPDWILAVSSPTLLKHPGGLCLIPRVTQFSNQYFKDCIYSCNC